LYLILLSIVGYVLLQDGKVQIHQAMLAYVGNPYLNIFFKYITHLGDGLFAFFVAAALLFKNVRISIYVLLTYLTAGILSYVLKHFVYHEVYRPHHVFQYYIRQHLTEIEGVDFIGSFSFPSGHALSAFALFFCLLFVTKNHLLKIVFFLLAVVAAYSRVYLSQHWLIDIYVGSIIGVCFSVLVYVVFYSTNKWPHLNTNLSQALKNKKKSV
jgi:membrane-associated phospholipid phosphatase